MSEITNLNVKLQNNPYAQYIIPVIEYFNTPEVRRPHPLEAIAIGSIMAERLSSWNNGGPIVQGISYELCCCPEVTLSGSNCSWVKKTPGTVGTGCPACLSSDESTARIGSSSPDLTARELLNRFAAEEGVSDPYTPVVTKFLNQMNGLIMDRANAYVFFQQIVDEFYANTVSSFMDYILVDWKHRDVFLSMLGGYFRDGFNTSGLNVLSISDGEAGATKAMTTITADVVLVADDQKYWEVYSDATNRWIFYLQVDGSGTGAPAYAPIGGITDHELALAVTTGTPPADIATAMANAMNLAPAWAFGAVTTGGVSDVTITTVGTGSFPASVDMGPAHDTWAMAFVDGTSGTAANEVTKINYDRALVRDMPGKWFKMWGAADDGVLFYYQYPDYPIDPAALGTTYATAVNIDLPSSYAKSDSDLIESLTTEAILGTGLFTAIGKDGCCDGNPPCEDPPAICSPRYSAILEEDLPNSVGGTAEVGPANQVNELIGPDGTNFGGDYNDDDAYAKAWNTIVVPDMKAKGRPTYYLKPIKGIPCVCCLQSLCPGGCIIIDCPDFDPDVSDARLGSVMLRTTYLSVTDDLKFNTPGSSFAIDVKDVCPSCLI